MGWIMFAFGILLVIIILAVAGEPLIGMAQLVLATLANLVASIAGAIGSLVA